MKLDLSKWEFINSAGQEVYNPTTGEDLLACLKDLREVLLKECDWTVGNDSPLEPSVKQDWAVWRQYLRDITNLYNTSNITQIVEIPNPPYGSPRSWVNVCVQE